MTKDPSPRRNAKPRLENTTRMRLPREALIERLETARERVLQHFNHANIPITVQHRHTLELFVVYGLALGHDNLTPLVVYKELQGGWWKGTLTQCTFSDSVDSFLPRFQLPMSATQEQTER